LRVDTRTRRIENTLWVLCGVRRARTRWEEDNEARLNIWAFVAVGGIVLAVAGLAVALALT
jgi:hypothetical protein